MRTAKIVSIILIMASMFTGIVSYAESPHPHENKLVADQQIIDKLTAIGLWNDYDLTATVKRSEFIAIVADLLCLGHNRSDKATGSFSDVTSEYKYYSQIEMMSDLGVIDSNDTGKFRPEEHVTYAEAVKILVTALGYGPYANAKGGYPTGYIITALGNKIVPKDLKTSLDMTLSYSDVAIMLDYTVEAKIFERESYGTEEKYQASEYTVLSIYHNINIIKGVMQSVGNVTIDENSPDTLKNDQVVINGSIFETRNSKPQNMLGYNVHAYYRKNEDTDNDVLIYVRAVNNNILELDEQDTKDCEQLLFSYRNAQRNSGRVSNVRLSQSIAVVKNGILTAANDLDLKNADRIIFIDNNNDGKYDVAILEVIDLFVVSDISHEEYTIYDKYTTELSDANDPNSQLQKRQFKLNPYHTDNQFDIVDDVGNPVDLLNIKPWTVVAVPENAGHQGATVIVTNRKFTAIIEELERDKQNSAIITVDGERYRTAKNLTDHELKDLQVGDEYTFYLDHNRRIAGFEITKKSGISYGFLVKAKLTKGLDKRVQFQVFAEIVGLNQPFKIFTSANRMELDGTHGLDGEEIFSNMKTNNDPRAMHPDPEWPIIDPSVSGGAVYFQMPIKYKLNGEGELTYLDTSYRGPNEDIGSDSDLGNSTLTKYNEFYKYDDTTNKYSGGGTYFQDLKYFRNSNAPLYIASSTVVMLVPRNPDQFDDVKAYGWTNNKYFESFTGYPRNNSSERNSRIEAYDVSNNRTADLIVYYTEAGAGETISTGTPLAIVEKISYALNDDGETVRLLHCYRNSSKTTVTIEADLPLQDSQTGIGDIKWGDVIRYGLNKKGELNRIEKVFDLDDEDDPVKMNEGRYSEFENEYGEHEITQDRSFIALSTDRYSPNENYYPKAYMQSDSFTSGYRVAFAKLLNKSGNNIVYRVYDLDPSKNSIEIATFPLHNALAIDEEQNKIYRPDINEFVSESENEHDASWMIIHTSGGKIRQLIMVKRAK